MNLLTLQEIAIHVTQIRSVEEVMEHIVKGLAKEGSVALCRLWLLKPGDICDSCSMLSECRDRSRCLHLIASAGRSRNDDKLEWTRIDGSFRRFPLHVRKVGSIGATGEAMLLRVGESSAWLANPEWAEEEGIKSFAGHPLTFRGEVLGVLALFSRDHVGDEEFAWLGTFANQAAVAIANARAFEELEELRSDLELERNYLREEMKLEQSFDGIVGESPAMLNVQHQVEMVAPTDASVLIHGESGTGKELIANAIHERSKRSQKAMVRVNCASIPKELFESEFFGHVKGAFTGASSDRCGRFRVADGGTIFLDEVGEIPLELQGKLLRVLQEGQFSMVGEDEQRQVDVRVIAATNRNLTSEAAAGTFRKDLYYRLSVFPIVVPPLRDRKEDILPLAQHFLRLATSKRDTTGIILRKKDLQALMAYDWPGNIRELQNVIERAVILSSHDRLQLDLKPVESKPPQRATTASQNSERGSERSYRTEADRMSELRTDILGALEQSGGKVSGKGGAAELLGIKATTLASRMKRLGI